ncbi:uncharacterized protein LOC127733677 [Mytilus californianus]|uniref:uncharacterized protein LOC127733677 n=1 Tax=Mytilus californianus TaxID=6549 RepID=UPI00224810ED|nr:uncharacterized protein LOC127733677 [Mytilus californianus]
MPLTETDAKCQGFQKISDCGDSSGLHGIRYVKDNDMNLILIHVYDVKGHIGGISAAVPKIKIPHLQSGITSTHWTKGKCFPTMGLHYWYNVRKNMSCDEFYPMFLLYNDGKLNAFGWGFIADLNSSRLEHPSHAAISAFINPPPVCLFNSGTLSTMHIYLSNNPALNRC